jgi:hypothetical protein
MTEKNEELPVHPAAELFPMMTGKELKELADDIKANGLVDPLLTHEGKLLDGRNRLAACRLVGVEPRYSEAPLNGHSALLFVVSKNLHRRMLTQAQRAAIAAELMPQLQAEAKERIKEGASAGGHTAGSGRPKNSPTPKTAGGYLPNKKSAMQGEARNIAATAMQVGKTSVSTAAAVRKADPQLFEQVKAGTVGLHKAHREVVEKQTAAQHRAAPSDGTRRQQMDQAVKRRMVEVLSNIRGQCRVVAELDMAVLSRALTDADRKTWISTANELAGHLRDFSRRLKEQTNGSNRHENENDPGTREHAAPASDGTANDFTGPH